MNPYLMKQIEEGMKAARMKQAQGMMSPDAMPGSDQYKQQPPAMPPGVADPSLLPGFGGGKPAMFEFMSPNLRMLSPGQSKKFNVKGDIKGK
jgi:hypothetical protein